MSYNTFRTKIPDWAETLEISTATARKIEVQEEIIIPEGCQFLIGAVTHPGNIHAWWLQDVHLKVSNSTSFSPKELKFFDKSETCFIYPSPEEEEKLTVSGFSKGLYPFEINFTAFLKNPDPQKKPSSFGCNACKITSKSLAAAIVAAISLPFIDPDLLQQLIDAVAAYLNVEAAVAIAFFAAASGNTADVIAEQLCEKIGLC